MSTNTKLAEALRRCERVISDAGEEDPGQWNWDAINADEGAQARDALAAYEQAQAQEPVGEVYCQEHCQFVEAQAAPEAQQAAGQEQDERAAFEAWAVTYSTFPLERDDYPRLGTTSYTVMEQTMLWDAWQARAALARCGEPLTDEQIVAAANEAFDTTIDLDDETLVNKYGHGIYISRYLDFARAIERAHGIGATTGKEPGND